MLRLHANSYVSSHMLLVLFCSLFMFSSLSSKAQTTSELIEKSEEFQKFLDSNNSPSVSAAEKNLELLSATLKAYYAGLEKGERFRSTICLLEDGADCTWQRYNPNYPAPIRITMLNNWDAESLVRNLKIARGEVPNSMFYKEENTRSSKKEKARRLKIMEKFSQEIDFNYNTEELVLDYDRPYHKVVMLGMKPKSKTKDIVITCVVDDSFKTIKSLPSEYYDIASYLANTNERSYCVAKIFTEGFNKNGHNTVLVVLPAMANLHDSNRSGVYAGDVLTITGKLSGFQIFLWERASLLFIDDAKINLLLEEYTDTRFKITKKGGPYTENPTESLYDDAKIKLREAYRFFKIVELCFTGREGYALQHFSSSQYANAKNLFATFRRTLNLPSEIEESVYTEIDSSPFAQMLAGGMDMSDETIEMCKSGYFGLTLLGQN